MQLIFAVSLGFLSFASVVSAMPMPVKAGDVHMAQPANFVDGHTGGGARIPHPVIAITGDNLNGIVKVVQGSHNLPPNMNAHAQNANNFVGGSGGRFTDKTGKHGATHPTKLAVGYPQAIHKGHLNHPKKGLPRHLTPKNTHNLQQAVGTAVDAITKSKIKTAAKQAAAAGMKKSARRTLLRTVAKQAAAASMKKSAMKTVAQQAAAKARGRKK